MEVKTERYVEKAREELRNPHTQSFLRLLPSALAAKRQAAYENLPDAAATQAYGASIRAEVMERLPELLEEFERNAVKNGARVFWARDGREANEYIARLAKEKRVRYVTKGKSMITEEVGLNELLESKGIEVWETDLGEFIAQLLKRPPFHIVGPAINIPVEQVRDVFLKRGVLEEPTLDPVELGYAARRFLREKFHHLDMGITGVNLAVAETGTIINVENEGNIRLNKSSPRTQVSVMSLEKVVPAMADAVQILRVLCRSCTGQSLGAYISMDSGPKRDDETDGPEELHIIILDNGRSRIFQDPNTREALRCIRCGACLNACPIYGKIGGYPYGWAYSGPMGQVLNPLLLGLDRTRDLYGSCTLCQRCKTICPAGVDHPRMLLYYRAKNVEGDSTLRGGGAALSERTLFKTFALAAGSSHFWRIFGKAVRFLANRFARRGKIRRMGPALEGWFRSRDLPAFPAKTFHDRWKDLKDREPGIQEASRRVGTVEKEDTGRRI
jgi:L-lactate dehydrogenase complex protein LldF